MRRGGAALFWALLCPWLALAQGFPAPGKAVRVVVGFPPGGGTDIQARLVAPKFSEALGAPVVIDNKPGASTMIAAQEVARAAPDGYTLLYTFSGTMAQNPHTLAAVPYDPFRDFTPISNGARGPLVLVAWPGLPAENLQSLIAYGKSNPGKLNCASFGAGTSGHINCELLGRNAGIEIVHVPYKGGADAYKDLFAGRVHLMFDPATTAVPNAKSGKLKMYGVVAERRVPMLPEVPTIAEQGVPGFEGIAWVGLVAPAGTPKPIIARLHTEVAKALAIPEMHDRFTGLGSEPVGNTPQEFGAYIRAEIEKWGKVIKESGAKVD